MSNSEFDDAYEDEQRIRGAILSDSIRALGPKEPICVRRETRLRDAIDLMNTSDIGCVLVTEADRLVGVFTERDVLKRVVGRLDLSEPVDKAMTPDPETVRMDDPLSYALNKMHLGGYRRLPVLDAAGRPVGVVSVRDFVRFIVSLFPTAALNLPPEPELGIPRAPGGA